MRSGMTKTLRAASANSICLNGCLSTIWKRLSSSAFMATVMPAMVWPNGSFCDQRLSEATASAARTGVPSWNSSPSRSVIVQVRSSAETSARSAICGCGTRLLSMANSVSQTM